MNKFFGVVKCLAVMIIFVVIQFGVATVAAIGYGIFYAAINDGNVEQQELNKLILENSMAISVIAQIVALIIMGLWYYLAYYKKEVKKTNKTFKGEQIAGICMLGLGLQFVINYLVILIGMGFPKLIEQHEKHMQETGMNELGVVAVLSTVILAPLLEEIVFRGIIIRIGVKSFKYQITVILLSSILFGAAHGIPLQIIYAFLLGTIIAAVYFRYRNLLLCMLLHAVFNASSYISILLQKVSNDNNSWLIGIMMFVVPITLTGIGSILVFKKDKDTQEDIASYVLDKKLDAQIEAQKEFNFNNTAQIKTDEIRINEAKTDEIKQDVIEREEFLVSHDSIE